MLKPLGFYLKGFFFFGGQFATFDKVNDQNGSLSEISYFVGFFSGFEAFDVLGKAYFCELLNPKFIL